MDVSDKFDTGNNKGIDLINNRRKMKILLVQDTDWLERGPHQQHHLMDRLSMRGHEIRVIDYEFSWRTKGNKERFSRRKLFNGVSKVNDMANVTVIRPGIIKLPVLDNLSLFFTHRREIKSQMKEFKPDVVIGFGILNTYLGMSYAKKKNIATIYYILDKLYKISPYKVFQPIARLFERKNYKIADKVIVINEKLKDYTVEEGAEPSKVFIISAGVNIEKYNLNNNGMEIRSKYRIKKDDKVLFFMGCVESFSGLREVALELARVKDKYPNLKLLIIGSGDFYEELCRIEKKYDLEGFLILPGQQPYGRVPDFLAAADICLLPAYNNEIMDSVVPIKMYEYMAAGKPVITTKLPGIMKEFGVGHGVIYVNKPEDALKKAIELIETGIIKEQGLKARDFVEKYRWDDIVNDFEDILKN